MNQLETQPALKMLVVRLSLNFASMAQEFECLYRLLISQWQFEKQPKRQL